jgi:hypothetical protein
VSSTAASEALCSPWITGEDVNACGDDLIGSEDPSILDDVAFDASWLLYMLSGQQYPGVCTATVRPCRASCTCWGFPEAGWQWWWGYDSITGWWWRARGSESRCGCGPESEIRLAGYPVLSVEEVKIDGAAVAPSEYRLDRNRILLRLDDPGPPVVYRRWPACQNITLPDTEPGTFSVTYTWGGDPPPMGAVAAAQVARQFWIACNPAAGECQLPANVTKIVRQGTTIERVTTIAGLWWSGSTGLPAVDAFLAAVNPYRARRRSMIWSPDLRQYPRRVEASGT